MKTAADNRRVLLAISETASLKELWKAVVEYVADARAEVITVFFRDDRWHRAASLPFTREVSRASGGSENFTLQRAEQLDRESMASKQRQLQQLADAAEMQLVFEVLHEHDAAEIKKFVRVEQDVLIAPSFFKRRPIDAELRRLKCRILYVGAEDAEVRDDNA